MSTIISIHVYCLLFLERKSTGAVLHCNGKIPCLASLLYSGTEFKMKNQGIIKVKSNKFRSNGFYRIWLVNKYGNEMLFCNILGSIQRGAKKELQHGWKGCHTNHKWPGIFRQTQRNLTQILRLKHYHHSKSRGFHLGWWLAKMQGSVSITIVLYIPPFVIC